MCTTINAEDLKEFRTEGSELLEAAETALLALEEGSDYKTQYNAIFRAFHNLKGAAGMMEMFSLQAHTHVLETELVSQKEKSSLSSDQIDYFLKGVDAAKKLLAGQSIDGDAHDTPAAAPAHFVEVINTDSSMHKSEHSVIEPTRFLLFSDAGELSQTEADLKKLNFEVHQHNDYIDGITKYDSLLPHVIIISPKFCQTSPEELKTILKKEGHTQLFIDFDFTQLPTDFLVKYARSHFENINLKNLANEASHLLKFQYSDLLDYLRAKGDMHMEKDLTEEMRSFLNYKSIIGQKFKTA